MSHGIAIVGANGSGKSTFGKYLAHLLGYQHMDVEDYYFKASAIPYTNSRTREEVQALLLKDMNHSMSPKHLQVYTHKSISIPEDKNYEF